MKVIFKLKTVPENDDYLKHYVDAALQRFAPQYGKLEFDVPSKETSRLSNMFPMSRVEHNLITKRQDELCLCIEISDINTRSCKFFCISEKCLFLYLSKILPNENEIYQAYEEVKDSLNEETSSILDEIIFENNTQKRALLIPQMVKDSNNTNISFPVKDIMENFTRLLRQIDWYMNELGVSEVVIASSIQNLDDYKQLAPKHKIEKYEKVISDKSFTHWIFITPYTPEHTIGSEYFPKVGFNWIGKRVLVCMQNAQIRWINFDPETGGDQFLVNHHNPRFNANIFNKIACHQRTHKPYFIQLHWFEHDDDGYGPRDEFGHRFDHNMKSLEKRARNHKVICMYGGSSVNSIFCLPNETGSACLERALNGYCQRNGIQLTFTVLNFGVPSAAILGQMQSYILFSPRVRPDIVISLDGHNDLIAGVRGSAKMTNDYYITYSGYSEYWLRDAVHSAVVPSEYVDDSSDEPVKYQGNPRSSVKAYWERKRQFMRFVQTDNTDFIWALQPLEFGSEMLKKNQSGQPYKPPTNGKINSLDALKIMYGIMHNNYTPPEECISTNLHEYFSQRLDTENTFVDNCHLTPEGEQILGDRLAGIVIKQILPTMTNEINISN